MASWVVLATGEMPPIAVERRVKSALSGATTGSSRPPLTIMACVRVVVNGVADLSKCPMRKHLSVRYLHSLVVKETAQRVTCNCVCRLEATFSYAIEPCEARSAVSL
jgi:hypothetical protein